MTLFGLLNNAFASFSNIDCVICTNLDISNSRSGRVVASQATFTLVDRNELKSLSRPNSSFTLNERTGPY